MSSFKCVITILADRRQRESLVLFCQMEFFLITHCKGKIEICESIHPDSILLQSIWHFMSNFNFLPQDEYSYSAEIRIEWFSCLQNGNISEFLLQEGFARCADWSMKNVTHGVEKLRAAEKLAASDI